MTVKAVYTVVCDWPGCYAEFNMYKNPQFNWADSPKIIRQQASNFSWHVSRTIFNNISTNPYKLDLCSIHAARLDELS